MKYRFENMLGVILLHIYFLLERHEMLVNVDSVVVLVETRAARN